MYVQTDKDGRIEATSEVREYLAGQARKFDFPEGFDFSTQSEYRIVNGKLTHQPKEYQGAEIERLKAFLRDTDWIAAKLAEEIAADPDSIKETAERFNKLYGFELAERRDARDRINKLEALQDAL